MRLTFIVIDDSELDCFIIKRILQHLNQDFIVAGYQSALDALSVISDASEQDRGPAFNLVFLDLKMPLMDGFEFIEAFEKLPLFIKDNYRIVVLSSTRNPSDIGRLLSYTSVDSIVEKPITREKLMELFSRMDIEA